MIRFDTKTMVIYRDAIWGYQYLWRRDINSPIYSRQFKCESTFRYFCQVTATTLNGKQSWRHDRETLSALLWSFCCMAWTYPDNKVHGANMGPIWGRQDPGRPHVGPMNFAIWVVLPRENTDVPRELITIYGCIKVSWGHLNYIYQSMCVGVWIRIAYF